MSREGYIKISIPKKDYEELSRMAKRLGYENVDEFAALAVLEHLTRLYRKKTKLSGKGLLDKYYQVRAEKPNLSFRDFLDTIES